MYSEVAKHTAGASKNLWGLSSKFFWSFKWHYFVLMLSDYGRSAMVRKYDAVTTDRAYTPQFSGLLGPLGTFVDRIIWNYPLHQALRERVQNVSDILAELIEKNGKEIRILSAPCGLIWDLILTKEKLERQGITLSRVHFYGLDLDFNGDVLPEARSRAEANGLQIGLVRDNIFNIRRHYKMEFEVVNCIGLISWMELSEVEALVKYISREILTRDGYLVIDNFSRHEHSSIGDDLEIYTRYFDPAELKQLFERCGLKVIEERTSSQGINTVYVLRRAKT